MTALNDALLLDSVLAVTGTGIAILDRELRFVRLNERLAEMNGIPIEAHIGRTPMELLAEVRPEAYLSAMRRALDGETVRDVSVRGARPVGGNRSWSVSYHPIRQGGEVVGVICIGVDLTDVHASVSRERRAAERLEQLQAISEMGLSRPNLDELLDELTDRVRSMLGSDTCTLLLLDPTGRVLRARAASGLTAEVRAEVAVPYGKGIAGGVAARGQPLILGDIDAVEVVSPYLRDYGLHALCAVPLLVDGRTIGVLHVGSRLREAFGQHDVALLSAAAARVALVIDRASAYEEQRSIAETLQRSLLPSLLPEVPNLELAARYVPSGAGLAVGGDWYDVQALSNGCVALVIGDVVGHGVAAAAAMGQLRTALRAHLTDELEPAQALDRLNDLVLALDVDALATVALALLDPADGTMRLAVAGHPPPLLRRADGTVLIIDTGGGPALGLTESPEFPEQTVQLEPGGALLLYTDGLVERRGAGIEPGVRDTAAHLASCRATAESCADTLIQRRPRGQDGHPDDSAILIANRPSTAVDPLQLTAAPDAAGMAAVRSRMRRWLLDAGANEDECDEVVLAVGEALAGVLANAGEEPALLRLQRLGDRIQAVVTGPGHPEPPSDTDRGRGLVLMEALSDLMILDTERGTEVRLSRTLQR